MAAGTTRSKAWVLNLDADIELAEVPGSPYNPTKKVREAMKPHIATLARSLLDDDGDILVDEDSAPDSARGYVGCAFCPTRRAIAILERAGATPAAHPSHDVLRKVNSRAFSMPLSHRPLPGSVFVTSVEEATAALATTPPAAIATQWRVKRAFGMAGRGHNVIAPGAPLSEHDILMLRRAANPNIGVQIEPDVSITRELGIHGMIDVAEGASSTASSPRFGHVVEQKCDPHGQWISTALASSVSPETHDALTASANVVAMALIEAGYFGPFGVDAFEYVDVDGNTHFQALSEINARYSMGYRVGMGTLAR